MPAHRCDRYELMSLPGVRFCRKADATVVADLFTELLELRAERAWLREKVAGIERIQQRNNHAAECPFCTAYDDEPHAVDCPVFTATGEIKKVPVEYLARRRRAR